MSSAPTADEIAQDARWLAQALDPASGMARLVAMDRQAYRRASFLDDRVLQENPANAQVVPWSGLEAALAGELRTDARWIFHIGHVGSTLVSRLLGEIDGVLGIREPRLLRDLAVSSPDVRRRYIEPIPKLMSRTFAAEEIACIKATSFASEIAPELVPAGERAIFMYARPINYVAGILAGENSLKELRQLADFRGRRLANRGIFLRPARNDAERAAAAWACEMTTLEAGAEAMSSRKIEWADFDTMLADMALELGRVATFLGFASDDERMRAIATGPLMQRYSKDLNYEYSPSLREELIEQELRLQGREIDAALAMLRGAAEMSPLLARTLSRAGG
jgi:hypothetical protein